LPPARASTSFLCPIMSTHCILSTGRNSALSRFHRPPKASLEFTRSLSFSIGKLRPANRCSSYTGVRVTCGRPSIVGIPWLWSLPGCAEHRTERGSALTAELERDAQRRRALTAEAEREVERIRALTAEAERNAERQRADSAEATLRAERQRLERLLQIERSTYSPVPKSLKNRLIRF
jgi:hypothetical protein